MIRRTDLRVTAPICTPDEAASLVHMPSPTVRSWMRQRGNRARIVHHVDGLKRGWPSIPLVGLAEVNTLRGLREAGLSMPKALAAARYIRDQSGDDYALANPHLVTDGTDAFLQDDEDGGVMRIPDRQEAFKEVMSGHLRRIVVGGDGYVEAFRVAAGITIDPRFNSGRMSFESNRVPVFAVIGALEAGEPPVVVAEDFRLSPEQVALVDNRLAWLAQAA